MRVDSLDDLLDERDPTPVPGKDLNPYVSEFVVSWAKEIPVRDQLAIRLHVSEDVSPNVAGERKSRSGRPSNTRSDWRSAGSGRSSARAGCR